MRLTLPAFVHGISFRLAIAGIACAMVLSLAFAALQLYKDFDHERERVNQLIERVIQVTRPPATRSVITLDSDLSNEVVTGLLSFDFVHRVTIMDENGFVLARGQAEPKPAASHWLSDGLSQWVHQGLREYVAHLPLPHYSDGTAGKIVILVDTDKALEGFYARVRSVVLVTLLQNTLLVLLLFAIFYFRLTRPLTALAHDIRSIKPDEPGPKRLRLLPASRKDELPHLIHSTNQLLDVVEDSLERRRNIEAALRKSERHLREIIDSLPVMIGARNRSGDFVFANRALADALGFTLDTMRAMSARELLQEAVPDVEQLLRNDAQVIESGRELPVFEERLVTHAGKSLVLQTHVMPLQFYDEVISLVVSVDVTERKNAQARMEFMAHHDALTGLPNRLQLVERLAHEVRRAQRHGYYGAVLFIDLDQFKTINDSLGHPVGDLVLEIVAKRLKQAVRQEDLVARLSGDEFVVLLTVLDNDLTVAQQRALEISEKIRALVARPCRHENLELRVTCSVGVVIYPEQDCTVHELLRYADTAMYQVKENGRDAISFFNEAMAARVSRQLELEGDLHKAIQERQFEVFFQPKLDVAQGHLVGAEALLRWKHPVKGMISPAEFIPVLESTGLIIDVGQWVLREACRQLVRWGQAGLWRAGMRLSVNISPRQFRRDEFVKDVLELFDEFDLPPRALDLEVTEGIVIERVDEAVAIMNQLAERGVSFSLDDFGTGYSSISYLKRLPVQTLKIDQSFVRDIIDDRSDRVLVETIITMGNLLGMELVAEGVETEQQLSLLRAFGCHSYQGYLFSPAVTAPLFESLLLRQAPVEL